MNALLVVIRFHASTLNDSSNSVLINTQSPSGDKQVLRIQQTSKQQMSGDLTEASTLYSQSELIIQLTHQRLTLYPLSYRAGQPDRK